MMTSTSEIPAEILGRFSRHGSGHVCYVGGGGNGGGTVHNI